MGRLKTRLGWLLLCFGLAAAAAPQKQGFSDKQLAQQQRMTDCSADAKQKGLKGDERMAFMKTCLSGGQVTVEGLGESLEPGKEPDGCDQKRAPDEADCDDRP